MATREELSKLKTSDLQSQLEARNLSATGKKPELVERLLEAISQDVSDSKAVQCDVPVLGDGKPAQSAQFLMTKLRLLKEKQEIEQEKLRVSFRSEQIDLELQLADVTGGELDQDSLESARIQSKSEAARPNQSADLVTSHLQRMSLPPNELKKFSGDVVEYRLWVSAFEARIDSKIQDDSEKLHYLDQFTCGVPNQLVRGCMFLKSDGYKQARALLEDRYGNSYLVIDEYSKRLREWPKLHADNVASWDHLLLLLREISNVMRDVKGSEFEHPGTIRLILGKFPSSLHDRFLRQVDSMQQRGCRVTLADVIEFLETEVRVKRNPLFGSSKVDDARPRGDSRPSGSCSRFQSHKVNAVTGVTGRRTCTYCNGDHFVAYCERLRFQPFHVRNEHVRGKGLCLGCLRSGHLIRSCRRRLTCAVCRKNHPTLLHRSQSDLAFVRTGAGAGAGAAPPAALAPPAAPAEQRQAQREDKSPAVVAAGVAVGGGNRRAFMPVVAVRLRAPSGKVVISNALLDGGSSGCFVTENLAKKLGAPVKQTTVSVDTVCGQRETVGSSMMDDVQVSGLDGESWHQLPTVFTLQNLPVTIEDRCSVEEVQKWSHLSDLRPQQVSAPVDLLIGVNAPHLHVAVDVRTPLDGVGPYGVRTVLGWYFMGSVEGGEGRNSKLLVNFLKVNESAIAREETSESSGVDMIRRMYDQEFRDLADDREGQSVNDREWLKEVNSNIRKDENGHYEVGLPKADVSNLPDSRPMAEKRLNSLRRRFERDPPFFEQYKAVIQGLLDDDYAEEVPEGEMRGPTWWLPHHAVLQPEKGKLRVVFDCASKAGGVCLNDLLKRGPNVTSSLLGVLLRFREGEVAFTCDVEAMFHRVHLTAADSDLFRFLWFRDNDLDKGLIALRMKSHVFGAVSSPSVAGVALKRCAEDGKADFPEAATILEKNTYVDDALVAKDTVSDAVTAAHDLQELCKRGGFNMTKFTSNSAELLKRIPVERRGKNVRSLDLDRDELSPERALGMKWSVVRDSFQFEFKERRQAVTRRGILSVVSSIFDPLGIVAPVTLTGKALLQKLCAVKCDWDDPIPQQLSFEWEKWLSDAQKLNSVELGRSVMGADENVRDTQLHIFVDASETGYSAVAYIRRERDDPTGGEDVSVSFLMGKSLVSPIRSVTIPRLELAAAVLGTRIRNILQRELTVAFDSVKMWTDSMVVLQYLRNTDTRFKMYVANRLEFIRSHSKVPEWAHVPSEQNPADVGSRGCSPDELGETWLVGPSFLKLGADLWPKEPSERPDLPTEEIKEPSPVCAAVVELVTKSPTDRVIEYHSKFLKLKRSVAWLQKFFDCIRNGSFRRAVMARRRGLRQRSDGIERRLTVSDLQRAEDAIIGFTQRSWLPLLAIRCEEGPLSVKKGSPLSCLKPCVRDGLLVVGGRLSRSASLTETEKHPVILPRDCHVSKLVIREAHEAVGHQGREHTFWQIRRRYWVMGAGPLVREMIRSCVTCRRVNGRAQQQQMADLPESRTSVADKAFTDVSLDVFGPFYVKQGRVERKRYGLVTVCSKTRAVHFEVLATLSTDSLINAIRRIAARRGQIERIWSDCGTNMVGANNELKEALRAVDFDSLLGRLVGQGIEWHFNPPTASHFGGSHERAIRTFRKIWRSMPVQTLTDESLQTLFCEIESIMNNRPLSYVTSSQGGVEPLTPSHLLLLRGGAIPVTSFSEADSVSRRQWRRVQYLADQFWLRWTREFVPALQVRQKWPNVSRNLAPGDVVLVIDRDVPRGQWLMGKVERVFPSRDNLVRKVVVRTASSLLVRPIHKLIVILPNTDL